MWTITLSISRNRTHRFGKSYRHVCALSLACSLIMAWLLNDPLLPVSTPCLNNHCPSPLGSKCVMGFKKKHICSLNNCISICSRRSIPVSIESHFIISHLMEGKHVVHQHFKQSHRPCIRYVPFRIPFLWTYNETVIWDRKCNTL